MFAYIPADPVCQKHLDLKESLSLVCLQHDCHNAGILCRYCSSESHPTHNVVSIHKLQDIIYHLQSQQPAATGIQQYIEATSQLSKNLKEVLLNFKERILKALATIEEQASYFYERVLWQMKSQAQLLREKQPLPHQLNFAQSLRTLDEKVRRMAQWYAQYTSHSQQSLSIIERCYNTAYSYTTDMTRQLVWAEEQCNLEISKVDHKRVQPKNTVREVWENQFSPDLRHPDLIGCQSRTIRAENSVINKRVCVMGNTVLEIKPATVYKCSIGLKEISRWVYLGMAIQQKVQDHGFTEYPWYQSGKGHYMLSEDGSVFSHSDAALNGKKEGFSFGRGDTILMEFNTEKMQLAFSKGFQSYRLNIAAVEPYQQYRFVVYLDEQSDTVELQKIVQN